MPEFRPKQKHNATVKALQNPGHIVISRTDNIGDVILTLPLAALLKQAYPHTKITLLARNYVKEIALNCPDIDHFLNWDELQLVKPLDAIKTLRQLNATVFLHAFPRKAIAYLAYRAKVPHRVGTTRRWYHILFCNHRINFSRAKSNLHEAQLNLKLLAPFGLAQDFTLPALQALVRVQLRQPLPEKLSAYLDKKRFNLILHPLSNGNGREWPMTAYRQLIEQLDPSRFQVIVTGSNAEASLLEKELLQYCPTVINTSGALQLQELLLLMQYSDGIVASGTGPLHMGAALGIHTLGLFPPKARLDPKRWGPVGRQAEYLVLNQETLCQAPCNNKVCACMQAITVAQVKQVINRWAHHTS